MSNALWLYGASGTSLSLPIIGSGTTTGPNVIAGPGSGYAPGVYSPDVQYNGSIYTDGARPIFAKAGNIVDVVQVNILGTSASDCLARIEQLQAIFAEARDVAMDPRRRTFCKVRLTVSGSGVDNYAILFGGSVAFPDTFMDAPLVDRFLVTPVTITIEREATWRAWDPQRSTTIQATADITPSATLTVGNYNSPFGTFNASALEYGEALTELTFSPISGGAINFGNVIVGARSDFRQYYGGQDNAPWPGGILEAEGGTLGTDAALAADATASPGGGGNTKVRISYATAANSLRLTVTPPTSGGGFFYFLTGTYRVFARLKLSGASTVTVYQAYTRATAGVEVAGAAVTFTSTAWTMVDLGLLTAEAAVSSNLLQAEGYNSDLIRIYSARTGAAVNLDIDAIVLVPVDEYYLTWYLAGSTWASQATGLLRASTLEPFGTSEFINLEPNNPNTDKPTSHIARPAGVGTGALYMPYGTTNFVYILGDSSWATTWSPAGAASGVRWKLQHVSRPYGPRA